LTAEELYNILLEKTSNQVEKVLYYSLFVHIKSGQGDYKKAIWYRKTEHELEQNILLLNRSDLGSFYRNIVSIKNNAGEYSNSLLYLERAGNIFQNSLTSNHPQLGKVQRSIEIVK
jgi:hypothetical protein